MTAKASPRKILKIGRVVTIERNGLRNNKYPKSRLNEMYKWLTRIQYY